MSYQEVNPKVEGIITVERSKPWGTSIQAIISSTKDVIQEPFAVINADDYYSSDSYKLITDFLTKECSPSLMKHGRIYLEQHIVIIWNS